MKRSIFLYITIILITAAFTCNAQSTWLRKRTFYVLDYIYNGEIIKSFEVPAMDDSVENPIFLANCVINKVNTTSDEEGRFESSEKIEIYCGKKPVINVSGIFETGVDKTNLFGNTVIESKDKSWVIFLPSNDSDVPGYAHLKSNGELTLVDLSEFSVFSDFNRAANFRLFDDRVELNLFAVNTESNKQRERESAKLIIFKDGKYKFEFNNN